MKNSRKYVKVSVFSFFVFVFVASIYVLFVLNLNPYCVVLPNVHQFYNCGQTLASWQYDGNTIQKMLLLLPELLILIVLGVIFFSKNIDKRNIKFLSNCFIVAIVIIFIITAFVG